MKSIQKCNMISLILVCIASKGVDCASLNNAHSYFDTSLIKNKRTKPVTFFAETLGDIGSMYKNLFYWDSFKTVVGMFPFYAAASMGDRFIHTQFYDHRYHKNINQLPPGFVTFAEKVVIPLEITAAGLIYFNATDERLRQTCKMYLFGLPFVVATVDLIKLGFKSECCYRPLHQHFSVNHKRAYGGFPSAHAAQVSFAAALFGIQYGLPAAVPLTILGTLVVVPFVEDNRHYVSQIVAGSALGVLYALAASKVVDQKFNDSFKVHVDATPKGQPQVTLAYNF